MYKCCIIVPVYKQFMFLDDMELISLMQLYNILGKHPVYFIGPASLEYKKFINHALEYSVAAKYKEFEDVFFKGIEGYNKLLLSKNFYSTFGEYEYMLIYQPDAFVFRDELDYWCSKGYDYIGAPWFVGLDSPKTPFKFLGVGNGGFSLRKISSHYTISASYPFKTILKILKNFSTISLTGFIIRNSYLKKYYWWWIKTTRQEDMFWGIVAKHYYKNFIVPTAEEALLFSFEVRPELMFELNNNHLPFGCHAWVKYNPEFWQPFIESYGYKLATN